MDAAGSPGQVTGRGGRERARRGRGLTPHVEAVSAGRGAGSPLGRDRSTLRGAGTGRPHGKLVGRWRGGMSASGQGPGVDGQRGVRPKSCARAGGTG